MLVLLALAVAHMSSEALHCAVHPDRIDITLPAGADPRIGSMAVVQGRRWAFLVDDQNHFTHFRSGMHELTIRPSRQLGAVDGKPVRVFKRAGTYRIVFADNLETEPENMISLDCLVRVR